mmetsp:Transcript_123622/g.219060  ORF Transcript_123622/g.219060 Transcript_123622/m.219060 type:complete len:273 (-) Transcript_123622:45-863(-)
MGQEDMCQANVEGTNSVQSVESLVGPAGLSDVQSPRATMSSVFPALYPAQENVNFDLAQRGKVATIADVAQQKNVDDESYIEQHYFEAYLRRATNLALSCSRHQDRMRKVQPCTTVAVEQLHPCAASANFSRWAPLGKTYDSRAHPPRRHSMPMVHDGAHAKSSLWMEDTEPGDACEELPASKHYVCWYQDESADPGFLENAPGMSGISSSSKVRSLHTAFAEIQSPRTFKHAPGISWSSNDFQVSCDQVQDLEKPFVHTTRRKCPIFHDSL